MLRTNLSFVMAGSVVALTASGVLAQTSISYDESLGAAYFDIDRYGGFRRDGREAKTGLLAFSVGSGATITIGDGGTLRFGTDLFLDGSGEILGGDGRRSFDLNSAMGFSGGVDARLPVGNGLLFYEIGGSYTKLITDDHYWSRRNRDWCGGGSDTCEFRTEVVTGYAGVGTSLSAGNGITLTYSGGVHLQSGTQILAESDVASNSDQTGNLVPLREVQPYLSIGAAYPLGDMALTGNFLVTAGGTASLNLGINRNPAPSAPVGGQGTYFTSAVSRLETVEITNRLAWGDDRDPNSPDPGFVAYTFASTGAQVGQVFEDGTRVHVEVSKILDASAEVYPSEGNGNYPDPVFDIYDGDGFDIAVGAEFPVVNISAGAIIGHTQLGYREVQATATRLNTTGTRDLTWCSGRPSEQCAFGAEMYEVRVGGQYVQPVGALELSGGLDLIARSGNWQLQFEPATDPNSVSNAQGYLELVGELTGGVSYTAGPVTIDGELRFGDGSQSIGLSVSSRF